ncbi:hypothetical protein [Mesorhizobium sp. CN2-181]|uniref:hypothetical protein n=1 Tax=Mesorhizobium yinganensis TaxID=3157707 RepID=UPI0032B70E7A
MAQISAIPMDVREAMGVILESARQRDRPFGVSDAVDQLRQQFPDLAVSDNDLVGAFVGEAVTADVKLSLMMSTANRAASTVEVDSSEVNPRQRQGRRRYSENQHAQPTLSAGDKIDQQP